MGPTEPDEALKEYPTTRYVIGRLAPAQVAEDDLDAAVDPSEDDTLAVGDEDTEDGSEDAPVPLIIGFNPSSIGLSFLVDASAGTLTADVAWGDYRREQAEEGKLVWRRYPRAGRVVGIPISGNGPIPRIVLSSKGPNPPGTTVTGIEDDEICLEGVVHEFAGYRAVSLFLVNRRTKGALGDRTKDERWIFQALLRVSGPEGTPVFIAKNEHEHGHGEDGEGAINELLFRHAREFASGHGVAGNWAAPASDEPVTAEVFTEFVPAFEVAQLIAPTEHTGTAILDMKLLAHVASADELVAMLAPIVNAYEAWVDVLEKATEAPEIASDPPLRDAARLNIERCRQTAARIRGGLDLLAQNEIVRESFQFANRVMWDQRVHSLWASSNRREGTVAGSAADFDFESNRTWRPFQMGFFLMNLRGIADPTSEDRTIVDLLWFPTGGGKTEAYLGLAAFTLALRRLSGDHHGMVAGAGVSIIMRYTLRLLTVQQFQRAAALIAACELVRRSAIERWGAEPFRIGVWVGRGTTPNTFVDSVKALEALNEGKTPKEGSPVQLVSCPRCGTSLVTEKGVPESQTYVPDMAAFRTRIFCRNPECDFCARSSGTEGLPVVVVDEEIYRTCPSFLVATVDKFARLPFKGETRALFGMRDRFSATYGHLTAAHGDKVESRKVKDAVAAPRLLPPELIIQDELHLISGPLGTMVGLYETAVDFATAGAVNAAPVLNAKIIASTATIRRAAQQVRQLYGRNIAIFPPSGITSKDSFFSRELPIDPDKDGTAGRLYVGLNAPGSSTKTLLVRAYAAMLAASQAELVSDAGAADPYATLVGYFNSLRALGGAKRLVEDDVAVRLRYLASQRGFPRRSVSVLEELTSRVDSWRIPGVLKQLDKPFPRGKSDWPVDVLLATNMISVGVDIDRLGIMVVTGQPKTTAEYIQATSRVGRKYPGLVMTMYNWLGARDLSHYERFYAYHEALYRHVEAISVTPFSSRALDRGLRGVFAALNRLSNDAMAMTPGAANFDATSATVSAIIEGVVRRAETLVGADEAQRVRQRLLAFRDDWSKLAEDPLRYSWLQDGQRPPNNERVLLRTSGTQNEGVWSTPGSLREVEATAAFYIEEADPII